MKSWLNDKSVQYWLEAITSPATKKNYLREFPKFLEFVKKSPDVMIDERREDLNSKDQQQRRHYEHMIIAFQNKLFEKGLASYTVHGYIRTVQSFFSMNGYPLKFRRKELKTPHPTKNQKHIVSNEEIRAMYSMGGVRERALLLTMYHTGLSPTDVCPLNIEHYDFYNAQTPLYFEKYREKSDMLTGACFSEECLYDIRLMLKERGNPKKGALFITQKNRRMDDRTVRDILQKLALKVGIQLEKIKTKKGERTVTRFKPKDLRDAYHDALERAGVNSQVIDRMMGHSLGGARDHYKISSYTVKEAYEKAFPYLTINQHRREREATQLIGKQLTKAWAKIENLTSKLDKLEKFVAEVVPRQAPELEYYDEVIDTIRSASPDVAIKTPIFDVIWGDPIVIEIRGYIDDDGKFHEHKSKMVKPQSQ